MIFLAGDQTSYTGEDGLNINEAWFYTNGYVAAAGGVATTAFAYVYNWADLSDAFVKVIVFNSVGTQLGISNPAAVAPTTPAWTSSSFPSQFTVTQGATYYLAIVPSTGQVNWRNDGTTFHGSLCQGTYSYADPTAATVPGAAPDAINIGPPGIYISGVSAESLLIPWNLRSRQNRPAPFKPGISR